MPSALKLDGQRFGRLIAMERKHQDSHGAWVWLCRCECGRYVLVRGATLRGGKTSACAHCAAIVRNTTHGGTGTVFYSRWRAMLDRCENRHHRGWLNYGGRGIKVCDEWHDFAAFSRDMRPSFRSDLELDRTDVNGHYEPGNCRWITHAEQQNNRRNNHRLTWAGRTLSLAEWSSLLGLKPNTLLYRIRRGWPLERAITKGVAPAVLLEIANQEAR